MNQFYLGRLGQGGLVGQVHPAAQGQQGYGAVGRARVELGYAQGLGKFPGPSALAGTRRSVDRDNHATLEAMPKGPADWRALGPCMSWPGP